MARARSSQPRASNTAADSAAAGSVPEGGVAEGGAAGSGAAESGAPGRSGSRSGAGSGPAIPEALRALGSLHRSYVMGEERSQLLAEYSRVPVFGHWLDRWGPDAYYGGYLILRSAVEGYLDPVRDLPREDPAVEEREKDARFTRWRWGIGCVPLDKDEAKDVTGSVWKTLDNRAKVVEQDASAVERVAWLVSGPPRVTLPELAGERPDGWLAGDRAAHWQEQVRRAVGAWASHRRAGSRNPASGAPTLTGPRHLELSARRVLVLTQLALARQWFAGAGHDPAGYTLLAEHLVADEPALWHEIPTVGQPSPTGVPPSVGGSGDRTRGQGGEPQARRRAERLAELLRAEAGRQAVALPRALTMRVALEEAVRADRVDEELVGRLERESASTELERQLDVVARRPDALAAADPVSRLGVRSTGVLVASSRWPRATQVAPADLRSRQEYIREVNAPGADRELVTRLFREYFVARRSAIDKAGYFDLPALAEIALADHGIAYDAVVFEDERVLRWVSSELGRPLAGRPDLYAYAERNHALTLGKEGRFGEALAVLGRSARALSAHQADHHPVYVRELGEQLRLAHAGLLVRVIEQLLLRANGRHPGSAGVHRAGGDGLSDTIAWAGAEALMYAHAALDDVTQLADMLGGLPNLRHTRFDDERMPVVTNVTKAWQIMPTVQALRAALAVRVAVAAGIVGEEQVLGATAPHGLATTDPWWAANRERIRDACSLEMIGERLLALLTRQPVTAAHGPLVVPLVLRYSFLTGGRVLPVAARSGGAVAAAAPFLVGPGADPDGSNQPGSDVDAVSGSDGDRPVIDWQAAAHWLSEGTVDGAWPPEAPARRLDVHYLSWLEPSYGRRPGRVYRALEDASGGECGSFREAHDPYRPDRPSHD